MGGSRAGGAGYGNEEDRMKAGMLDVEGEDEAGVRLRWACGGIGVRVCVGTN